MIRKLYFAKKQRLEVLMKSYEDMYKIQSEIKKGLVYCIDGDQFAMVMFDGAITCPVEEIPQLAAMLKSQIKKELMEVFAEINDLRRLEIKTVLKCS